MKFTVKTLLLVWLMFVAIQVSAQTTSTTPKNVEKGIIINQRPIKDFADYVAEKVEKDKVDLNAPFVVEFESVLGTNGRLDPKLSKFTKTEGDEKLIEIVKNGIAAINDAGYLKFLRILENKKGFVSIQQDKDTFLVSIKAELESELKARNIASGLNSLMAFAKSKKTSPEDKDDLVLLNSASVKSEGKFVMLNFLMPQAIKQNLITKKLDELKMERY